MRVEYIVNVDEARGVCKGHRLVAGGVLWVLPTPLGKRCEFM